MAYLPKTVSISATLTGGFDAPTGGDFDKKNARVIATPRNFKVGGIAIIWVLDNDHNVRGLDRSSLIFTLQWGLEYFTYEGPGKRSPILYIHMVHK